MSVTVTSLGAVQSSSSASISSLTLGQAFVEGDVIHLAVTCGPGQTISSITGTLGITFTPAGDSILDAGGASYRCAHFVGVVPSGGKATGLVVSANYSAATTQRGLLATVISGLPLGVLIDPTDFAGHGTGNGSATTAPTGTFGAAPDTDDGVVIAAVFNDGVFAAAPTNSFTETQDQQVGTNKKVQINHRVFTSGMAALTGYTANIAGSASQSTVLVMAIRSTPLIQSTMIGSDSPSGSASTIVLTGVNATAGDYLFAAAEWNSNGTGEACVMSDSVNGNWPSFNGGANSDLQVSVAQVGAALNCIKLPSTLTGATVTATLPGSRSGRIIAVWVVPAADMLATKTNDTTGSSAANTTGSSTTAAPSSKTPLTNPDYDVLIVGTNGNVTFSTPAGYVKLFDLDSALVDHGLAVYATPRPTVNNTARNPSVTLGAGAAWVAAQCFYKASTGTTPASITPAASGVTFSGTGSLAAPTGITPADSGVSFDASGSVTAPTSVATATAGVSFGASGTITAPTSVVPAAAGVTFGAAGSITSIPRIAGSGSVSFAGSSAITAPTAITPTAAGVAFGASGAITAPTSIVPATSGVSFGAAGSIATPARIIPASAGVAFGGSGAITASSTPMVAGTSSVSFAGAGAITAPTRLAPATSGVAFGASGAVSAPTRFAPATTGVAFTGTGGVSAPGLVAPSASGVAFGATGSVTAPTVSITFQTTGVAFGAAATLADNIAAAAAGVTFGATATITAFGVNSGPGHLVATGAGHSTRTSPGHAAGSSAGHRARPGPGHLTATDPGHRDS